MNRSLLPFHLRLSLMMTFCVLQIACSKVDAPPPDPLMRVLSAVERGAWHVIADHFSEDLSLENFPLKKAVDEGFVIDGVKRIRMMDRHLLFDVDVRGVKEEEVEGARSINSRDFTRYSFWLEVTTPERMPSEPLPTLKLGKIKGWSKGRLVSTPLIEMSDIQTPSRFSATSFRGVPELQSLAVFEADNLDLKGWSATMIKLEPEMKPLERHGCRRVNVRVSRAVLENEIKSCSPLLAREAQRAHLMGAMTIKGDVALHDQERGSFAGSLTLKLPLDFDARVRPDPELIEAMIVGKEFTECVQQKVSQWSKDYLPQAACELQLPMLFKVSMPLQTLEPSPSAQEAIKVIEEGAGGQREEL